MLNALKCDLLRTLKNSGFVFAVVITAVLCFTVQIYSDPSNGKEYSVFEAIISLERSAMSEYYEFSPPIIIRKALSGYSAMVLPVTAALPFVLSFISELNNRNIRFTIFRTGRVKYYLSKFISAVLIGGLCTLLGVAVFGAAVYILFPNGLSAEMLADFFPNGVLAALIKKALSSFVYGAVSVLPAFFLCSFCTNPYIVLCVPFLLKFIIETILSAVQTSLIAAGNFDIYQRLLPFYPNSASLLFDMQADENFTLTVVINLIAALTVFAGFFVIMEKRTDRGG